MLSSKAASAASAMAIEIITQQGSSPNRSRCRANGCHKPNHVKIEWQEPTKAKPCPPKARRVRFDPRMDWTVETKKSEQGHLQRRAEREIRKRLERERQDATARGPSRRDRQTEVFLYVVFADVDGLVDQYQSDKTLVVRYLFDRLFEDAGIPTTGEQAAMAQNHGPSESSAWLWASFVALQIRYRKVYDDARLPPPGRTKNHHQSGNGRGLLPGMGKHTMQALEFLHWLAPAFGDEARDAVQRKVFAAIVGTTGVEDGAPRCDSLEEYVLREDEPQASHRDLRALLLVFFRTAFGALPPRSASSSSYSTKNATDPRSLDLAAGFAAMKRKRAEPPAAWTYAEDPPGSYESLEATPKRMLFLVAATPAFRAFGATERPPPGNNLGPGLWNTAAPAGSERAPAVSAEAALGAHPMEEPIDSECPPLLPRCDDYEFAQELCHFWFDGAKSKA